MRNHRLRLTVAAVCSVLAVGLAAAPAVAAEPIVIMDVNQFVDLDPCTETPHLVTVTRTITLRNLDNAQVGHADISIVTSSGYEGRGTDTRVVNGNVFSGGFSMMLTNDATGQRIAVHAKGLFNFDQGQWLIDTHRVTCVGG